MSETDVEETKVEQEADIQPETEEIEAEARAMGWVPEEEWRGAPPKGGFATAAEFVEKGKTLIPFLNRQIEREREKNERLNKTLRDEITGMKKRAYDQAYTDIQARQRQAVENGDADAFDKAEEEKKQLDEQVQQETTHAYNPDTDPVFTDWLDKNQWYNSDRQLARYANGVAPEVAQRFDIKQGDRIPPEYYEAIAKEVREAFPDKFTRKRMPASVETGGGGGRSGSRKKTFSDLPDDARATADSLVKDGTFKDRQAYVDAYFKEFEE